jgi:hypothetical protein
MTEKLHKIHHNIPSSSSQKKKPLLAHFCSNFDFF